MLLTDTTRTFELPGRPRRSEQRYKVAAQVSFQWRTEGSAWHEGRGITRDMSGNSLFILSHPVPVPGAAIIVTVAIPSLSVHRPPIVVRGHGRVVRIEPEHGQPIGFAATVVFEDGDAVTTGEA